MLFIERKHSFYAWCLLDLKGNKATFFRNYMSIASNSISSKKIEHTMENNKSSTKIDMKTLKAETWQSNYLSL